MNNFEIELIINFKNTKTKHNWVTPVKQSISIQEMDRT